MTTKEKHTGHAASSSEQVTAETTADGRIVVHTASGDLPFDLADGRALVECEPFGAWLGYAQPRNARSFALKLARDRILGDSDFCTRRVQNGRRGRPLEEVWLTRRGALKLAARSDTPRAKEMLDLVVTVFEAVVDRREQPRAAPSFVQFSDALVKLTLLAERGHSYAEGTRERVEVVATNQRQIAERLERVERRVDAGTHAHGLLGREKARELLDETKAIASIIYVGGHVEPGWKRLRGLTEAAVRRVVEYYGPWEYLRGDRVGDAWKALAEQRKKTITDRRAMDEASRARATAEAALRQRTLFDALPPGVRAFQAS